MKLTAFSNVKAFMNPLRVVWKTPAHLRPGLKVALPVGHKASSCFIQRTTEANALKDVLELLSFGLVL
jgi:hypothetical protein